MTMQPYDFFVLALNMFWTIAVFSFLIGENPLYRFTERQMLGVAMAWVFSFGVKQIMDTIRDRLLIKQQYVWILPLILGVFLYARYSKKYSWLTRYPTAIMVGITIGLSTRAVVEAQIVKQIVGTFLPVVTPKPVDILNNVTIVLSVVLVLVYFFFAKTPSQLSFLDPYREFARKAARLLLMVTLGSYFGNRAVGDVAKLIDRLAYLLQMGG